MPALDSLYRERTALWAPYYAILEQQLGATATLVDIAGQRAKPNATTWTGRKFSATGLSPVWTPSEALSAWDVPINPTDPDKWQGLAPELDFNGTDEEADTPDADFWTRVETAAFSVGMWFRAHPSNTSNKTILAKWDETTDSELREWRVRLNGNGRIALHLYDESANVEVNRQGGAVNANQLYFLVVTYTGDGGADAADSINLYIDGALSNSTIVNNASYVAMENLATNVKLGFIKGATANAEFLQGKLFGGPWSPFFVQAELTAAQVFNLYENMRLGLGV